MKTIALVSGFCVLLAGVACQQPGPPADDLPKRVQAVEAAIDALQKRASDLQLKGAISSSLLLGSPLDNFFNSAEFWENTYDSGQADCAKRCITSNTAARAACQQKPPNQQQACFQAALMAVTACQRGCSSL